MFLDVVYYFKYNYVVHCNIVLSNFKINKPRTWHSIFIIMFLKISTQHYRILFYLVYLVLYLYYCTSGLHYCIVINMT